MTVKLPAINNLAMKDRDEFLELRESLDRSIEIMKQHPALVIY